jgi:hypothetical protein
MNRKPFSWRTYFFPFLLFIVGGGFVWLALQDNGRAPRQISAEAVPTRATLTPSPTHTPEPIIPTRTPTAAVTPTSTAVATRTARPTRRATLTAPPPTSTPRATVELSASLPGTATVALTATIAAPISETVSISPTETAVPLALTPSPSPPSPTAPAVAQSVPIGAIPNWQRFGVTVPQGRLADAEAAGLRFGSFLDWWPGNSSSANYWPMIRVSEQGLRNTSWEQLDSLVPTRPGSYWLVGNEMDVKWQDNVTPERYAEIYHDVYTFLKERDPSAKVVIGGVSQPTPLRRAYLDRVLNAYQSKYGVKMPIDVWNVHGFILREEAGSWGVDIPPGMSGAGGMLYEIDDHTNIEIFKENLIAFRQWMAERGYGDKPLVITEYGILMPVDYGFGPEETATFLRQTLDFMTTAVGSTGYAPDNGRLVQWWFWYGVWENETRYPAGNLYDVNSNGLTPAGRVFSDYPR